MAQTKSVEYIVDEKGRKKTVVMSYKAYLALLEDIEDLRVKSERSSETPEDFSKVLEDLKNAGRRNAYK